MKRTPFNPGLIELPPGERPATSHDPMTVSQITLMVKRAIEANLPRTVHVVGQISNFKRHSSGHLYFTLKDDASEISCVMWKSAAARLKFDPSDGLEVLSTGSVEVFERAGRYQLYVRKIEPRGVGALELAFQQLCEKLAAEGLFDARHKETLPPFPTRIAVITSPTGAAITDILRTLARRYPGVDVLIYPVRVQGPGAADEIAGAITRVNLQAGAFGGVDLLIVGRGGGSLEDLWAFNEEVVARAIFASRIPIISAVGHEVDVTIADLVADVRAATPTAAAELAVPMREDVAAHVEALAARMTRAIDGRVRLTTERLAGLLGRASIADPMVVVHRREQVIDELSTRMERAVRDRARDLRNRLDQLEQTLQRIAPHAYLLRTSERLREAEHRLRWAITAGHRTAANGAQHALQRLDRASPARTIETHAQRVVGLRDRMIASRQHRSSLLVAAVESKANMLAAMSYKSVLGRGFTITRMKKGRKVIRSCAVLRDGDRVVTELCDGEFESQVLNLRQLELFDD